jgi:hypothetical protein
MNKDEYYYLNEEKGRCRSLFEKLFQHIPEALKESPLVQVQSARVEPWTSRVHPAAISCTRTLLQQFITV